MSGWLGITLVAGGAGGAGLMAACGSRAPNEGVASGDAIAAAPAETLAYPAAFTEME